MSRAGRRSPQSGYTLVELLVVLGVVGVFLVPLTAWVILTLRTAESVDQRSVEARGLVQLNTVFRRDLANAGLIQKIGAADGCKTFAVDDFPIDQGARVPFVTGPTGQQIANVVATVFTRTGRDPANPVNNGGNYRVKTVYTAVRYDPNGGTINQLTGANETSLNGWSNSWGDPTDDLFDLWRTQCRSAATGTNLRHERIIAGARLLDVANSSSKAAQGNTAYGFELTCLPADGSAPVVLRDGLNFSTTTPIVTGNCFTGSTVEAKTGEVRLRYVGRSGNRLTIPVRKRAVVENEPYATLDCDAPTGTTNCPVIFVSGDRTVDVTAALKRTQDGLPIPDDLDSASSSAWTPPAGYALSSFTWRSGANRYCWAASGPVPSCNAPLKPDGSPATLPTEEVRVIVNGAGVATPITMAALYTKSGSADIVVAGSYEIYSSGERPDIGNVNERDGLITAEVPVCPTGINCPGAITNWVGTGITDTDGRIVAGTWDWGDGTTSSVNLSCTGTAPTEVCTTEAVKVYFAAGTYRPVLTVVDDSGNSYSEEANSPIVITGNTRPTAVLTISPNPATSTQAVTFDGSASFDPDAGGSIVKSKWEFSFGGNPACSAFFDQPSGNCPLILTPGTFPIGTHTATLTVRDNQGATHSVTQSFEVTASNPVAVISPPTASGSAPYTVTFASTGSYDPDGTAISAETWNCGPGGVLQPPSTCRFDQPGPSYTVTLTVTDSDPDAGGPRSGSATRQVTVGNAAPSVTLAASSLTGRRPLVVNFTATGSDPDNTVADPNRQTLWYDWDLDNDGDFDDAPLSTTPTASFTYDTTGMPVGGYTARVRVRDGNAAGPFTTGGFSDIDSLTGIEPWIDDDDDGVRVALDCKDDPAVDPYAKWIYPGAPDPIATGRPNLANGLYPPIDPNLSATDPRLVNGVLGELADTNCDGLDGVWQRPDVNGVMQESLGDLMFADPAGSTDAVACGTRALPCKKIGDAVTKAKNQNRLAVFAKEGDYGNEGFELKDGITVWGRFNATYTARGTGLTIVKGRRDTTAGAPGYVITAQNITNPTRAWEMQLQPIGTSTFEGASTYGIAVFNSTVALEFRNVDVKISGGTRAGPGKPGLNGSDYVGNGPAGSVGMNSQEKSDGCWNDLKAGGPGGGNGGQGGFGGQANPNGCNSTANPGSPGVAGTGNLPGFGGAGAGGGTVGAGIICSITDWFSWIWDCPDANRGADGQNGSPGATGAGGAKGVAALGAIQSGWWSPAASGTGGTGALGSVGGGGGGGGGGGASDVSFSDDMGAGGGGGGGGGLPAPVAGTGGTQGAAYVGVYLNNSSPRLINMNIEVGAGGRGGNGGNGGLGGPGGLGARGGAGGCNENTSYSGYPFGQCNQGGDGGVGGRGGNGGQGGHSGGGGGGAGGPAIGILSTGSYTQNETGVTIVVNPSGGPAAGAGGTGGLTNGVQTGINGDNGQKIARGSV